MSSSIGGARSCEKSINYGGTIKKRKYVPQTYLKSIPIIHLTFRYKAENTKKVFA